MSKSRNRIGFVVEGRTEVVFLSRFLLPNLIGWNNIDIECFPPPNNTYSAKTYRCRNDKTLYSFVIIDAGGDRAVFSKIRSVYQGMIDTKSYLAIYGLRDLFSEEYRNCWRKYNPGRKLEVSEEVVNKTRMNIQRSVEDLDQVKLFFCNYGNRVMVISFS